MLTSIAANGTLVKWYSCMDADTASSSCPPPPPAPVDAAPEPEPGPWSPVGAVAAANLMQLKARGVPSVGCPPNPQLDD